MKKSIVAAGVSAVALAAMPAVGVFATTEAPDGTIYGSPIVDNFSITVDEVCTLSRKSTPHTAPTVNDITGTWAPTGTANDTFSANLVAGTEYAGLATSDYNVTCNAAVGGYAVTVDVDGLTKSGADAWNYVAETAFSGNSSQWFLTSSAKKSDATTFIAIDDGEQVWSTAKGTAVESSDFTITYSFKPKTTQQIGTYTGSATYALINL